MRFHKAESAFFVFIVVLLAAGLVTFYAYFVLEGVEEAHAKAGMTDGLSDLKTLIYVTGVLQATALIFGIFLFFPLIRTQVKEEGKLRAMTKTLSKRSQTLEQAALTDGLTSMHNRRYFDDALREYIDEFRRIDRPVGLMLIDLDHFKQVNDTYGHDVGDEVLRAVAECLRSVTRYHDVAARLGGEEFAIVAPNMDAQMLAKFAERIRLSIANMPIQSRSARLNVTASLGLAVWDGKETGEEFYRRADRLLYQAKSMGRNRICA